MTDVLVTYEDGSTELRPANCPALAGDSPTTWHPSDFTMTDVVPARPEPVVAFLRPGERRGTHALRAWRWSAAMVWCITGGYGKGEPLTGEWRLCRVETMAEQIERLTRERDAAKARAAQWKKAARRLRWWAQDEARGAAHLRRGAKAMLSALSDENTDVKPSSVAASLVVWAEYVRDVVGRCDAAEKRLADLRAWAEDENNWDGFHAPDVIGEVLARIDGKEDT